MKPEELLKQKREEILRICAKHGAYKVRIFGSVARGEAIVAMRDVLVRIGRPIGMMAGEVESRQKSSELAVSSTHRL